MKANRRGRGRPGDDAVSTVLGGILFFALIIMFLIVIRTTFAPVWQEEDEAKHMSAVQGQFAALAGAADSQASNATSQAVGLPVTLLERQTSRFFTPPNLPASLAFEPGTADVRMSTSEFLILQDGGQSLAGLDEDWQDISGDSIEVHGIEHLRLRVLDPGNEADGNSVTITVNDADGDFAGDLQVRIRDVGDGYVVTTRVRSDTGTLYDQGTSYFDGDTPTFHWVDALAPELHFADVLRAAAKPATLDFSEAGMQGQYAITWRDDAGTLQGGSGVLLQDWAADYVGGILRLEAQNQRFPGQTYELHNGAVLLTQDDGQVLRTDPFFDVRSDATGTRLSMVVPSLVGEGDAVSTNGAVTVSLDGRRPDALVGTAPTWTWSVDSPAPAAWADMWERALGAAGLSEASGHFSITTTATTATLDVIGVQTGAVHDLTIELHHALVEVRLRT